MNTALTFTDLIDPAQLVLIRQASRRLSISPEDECQKVMSCGTGDLSKSAADEFIKYLWQMEEKGVVTEGKV